MLLDRPVFSRVTASIVGASGAGWSSVRAAFSTVWVTLAMVLPCLILKLSTAPWTQSMSEGSYPSLRTPTATASKSSPATTIRMDLFFAQPAGTAERAATTSSAVWQMATTSAGSLGAKPQVVDSSLLRSVDSGARSVTAFSAYVWSKLSTLSFTSQQWLFLTPRRRTRPRAQFLPSYR